MLISLELTFFIVTGERVSVTVLSACIDTDLSITSGTSQPFLIKSIPFILVFSFLFITPLVEIRRLIYKKYFTLLFCVALVTIVSIYYKLEVYKAYLVEWGGYTENDYGSKKLYFQKLFYHQYYPVLLDDAFYIGSEFYELWQAKKLMNHEALSEGVVFNKEKIHR